MSELTLRDMSGETALVTGATSGIGRHAAVLLGRAGARVLVHGRNEEAGAKTVQMVEDAGGEASFHGADFADLDEVRALADEVREETDELAVLANNAGLTVTDYQESKQGYELHLAVNHLATYLLTHDLVDHLADEARVVTTSSLAHRNGGIDFDTLAEEGSTGDMSISGRSDMALVSKLTRATGLARVSGLSGFSAYSDSKLANVLFTRELAARLPAGQTANCFHPGVIPGSGFARGIPFPLSMGWEAVELVPGVTDSVEDGGRALAYLAASPALEGVTGQYFDQQRQRRPSRSARDDETADRLWDLSADLVGVDPDWP
ncbi:SDR family NAD(P)-dependent oxidoreductase [Salinirubellus salinus]|uniref:SDR family NAD(P)-dependent oxidoreductase n=1 Tax=Salinirubellus salinus TaxID=1364945 RepID=A0A9E7R3P3_9EURY|nr:SDR family NAD(P)-dependent oxidoreductase [Salinirubellus salinus]UWM54853.1 SDR family NAD(P)-dependent oxidoreductase [Salinirubellus salinus]